MSLKTSILFLRLMPSVGKLILTIFLSNFLHYIEDPDVFPIQVSGAVDTDLTTLSSAELMGRGLYNLGVDDQERPYGVRHGRRPVSDFPTRTRSKEDHEKIEILSPHLFERAFLCLFPFGEGGIESPRPIPLSFTEHVRWCLRYHDRRFRIHETFPFVAFGIEQKRSALGSARIQMKRSTFQRDARLLSTINLSKLERSKEEENRGLPVSDPALKTLYRHLYATAGRVIGTDQNRYLLRSKIWSTTFALNPPSLWITINPCDLHDPIAQVFAGENIDLDNFLSTLGPDKERRAYNVANDPYSSANYFHTIISIIIETLFGIKCSERKITRKKGIFGYVSAYIGTVESQNRGSLHLHMLLWLVNAPSSEEMRTLLKSAEFRDRVKAFIKQNLRAYLPGLDSAEALSCIPNNVEVAYSRPPNPDDDDYREQLDALEFQVVRSKQVHTCSKSRCLVPDKKRPGKSRCKRGYPFTLSNEDSVDEQGRWYSKRLFDKLNGWIPAISINVRCNNDGKLLTNGEATKNVAMYILLYATKKQGQTFVLSTVVAKVVRQHAERNDYLDSLLERQRLLVFRIVHAINREQELSAPMVMSYLMGWGDTYMSHQYSSVFWRTFLSALLRVFPDLKNMNEIGFIKRWDNNSRGEYRVEFINRNRGRAADDKNNNEEPTEVRVLT